MAVMEDIFVVVYNDFLYGNVFRRILMIYIFQQFCDGYVGSFGFVDYNFEVEQVFVYKFGCIDQFGQYYDSCIMLVIVEYWNVNILQLLFNFKIVGC